MKIVQCTLTDGPSRLTTWLDVQDKLRPGVFVTLKDSEDPTRRWKVESIGDVVMEKAEVVGKTRGALFGRDMHRKNGSWENCD